jgi:hypothetical protein
MGLRELIGGGLEEVSGILSRTGSLATIKGRSFPVVIASVDRSKVVEVDGFIQQESAPFVVRKTDLSGHTVDSLQGEILTFEGRQYRLIQVIDNGLAFTLRCVSKEGSK